MPGARRYVRSLAPMFTFVLALTVVCRRARGCAPAVFSLNRTDMNRVLSCMSICTSLLLVLTSAAAAQRIDSPYRFQDHGQRVGVYGGQISTSEGQLGVGPQSAPTLGARWALRVSGPFSIGVEAGYTPATRTVRDTVFNPADSVFRAVGEADMHLLTVMGVLHFSLTGARTWNALQPFIELGGGAAIDLAGSTALEAELPPNARYDFGTSFAGQFGAGVAWFPTQRLSVRVDARNVIWRLSVPEAFVLTAAGRTLERSQWENNFALAAGLSIHF
jgi:hypothetical protein